MTSFSETLMDHFQSPRNQGRMEKPDLVGGAGVPGRGRYIVLYLQIANDQVKAAQFECYGCGVTVAVCSVLTELIQGKPLSKCVSLQVEQIIEALDGIPPYKQDCAHFGITALKNAIEQSSITDDSAKTAGHNSIEGAS